MIKQGNTQRPREVSQVGILLRDRRGISTLEYAVIFITILIGGLALWSKLGKSMNDQVSNGATTLNAVLGAAQQHANDGESAAASPGSSTPAPTPNAPANVPSAPGPGSKKLQSQ